MAYMRGPHYVWSGGDSVHLWAKDGSDGWEESGWAEAHNSGQAGGVAIPGAVLDELAVMRVAELLESGELSAAVDRAVDRHRGNFGCEALARQAARLKELRSSP